MNKPWYQKWWIWLIAGCIVISIPFIINELYKRGTGYVTMWDAADMLSFYGSILSFLGTIVLGIIAVSQSRQANRLSERMLKFEESHYLPIVDIVEIINQPQMIPANTYNNSLHLYLNENHFHFNDDNTIADNDGSIAVFLLSNVCSSHIISIIIEDVEKSTIYANGERIETKVKSIAYNGGIHVLGSNEAQYLLIGGAHFEAPRLLAEQEILDLNYINPTIELIISFILVNSRGRKFCEKIKIRYTFLPSENDLIYPCILAKEILCIEEET
jgi:hypothetical protein